MLFCVSLDHSGKLVYLCSLDFLSSVFFNLCPPFALYCNSHMASPVPGAPEGQVYQRLYWRVVMPLEWAVKVSLWRLLACNCLHPDSMCELALCSYEVCFLHDFWALISTSMMTSAGFSARLSTTHCPLTDIIVEIIPFRFRIVTRYRCKYKNMWNEKPPPTSWSPVTLFFLEATTIWPACCAFSQAPIHLRANTYTHVFHRDGSMPYVFSCTLLVFSYHVILHIFYCW